MEKYKATAVRDVQGALPGDGGLRLELLLRAGGQEGHPAVLCYLLLQPSPDGGGGRHWLLLHEAGGLGHPAEWCFDMEAQKVEAGVVINIELQEDLLVPLLSIAVPVGVHQGPW